MGLCDGELILSKLFNRLFQKILFQDHSLRRTHFKVSFCDTFFNQHNIYKALKKILEELNINLAQSYCSDIKTLLEIS